MDVMIGCSQLPKIRATEEIMNILDYEDTY